MISIPFSGSKKFSYKNVKEIFKNNRYNTVFEPFGGSCVLSVNLKKDGLVKRAVANDFDRFFDNYLEYLAYKDWVVNECLVFGINPIKTYQYNKKCYVDKDNVRHLTKQVKLDDYEIEYLRSLIKQVPKKLWRYLSLGGNFTFSSVSSHKEIKLNDFSYFGSYLQTDKQRKYLEILNQITIEHLDYLDFLEKYKDDFNEESLIILDPPYTNTFQNQYKTQFDDKQTKDLIDLVSGFNCDFIFFNHNINKVKDWLEGLDYSIEFTGSKTVSANHKRKDVMAYVVKDKAKLVKTHQASFFYALND